MTRPTLKLTRSANPGAAAKPPTSRARRAQHGKGRPVGHVAPPPAAAPEPAAVVAAPAATTTPPAAQAPGPRHANPDDPRLSKRMSELGLCSRREADEWIENGWVKVDGQVVATLGVRVPPHARIDIDPAASRHQAEQVTILLNKPVGYVSGQAEDGHEPAIVLIRPENRWADDPSPMRFRPGHLRGLAPAGRLDIDSTGLLVFTQDGRVARHLIGGDSTVEKEYLVRVEGVLPAAGMKLLQHGLELDGVRLKPARVSWQNEHQLRFVLREGRKRQIRRMCELVGLTVTGLKRVRSGGVPLGPLPVGQWRYLRRDEKF
jgi:23S rRNA pseudouridine2604 synthase